MARRPVWMLLALLGLACGCRDDDRIERRHEPMRAPAGGPAAASGSTQALEAEQAEAAEDAEAQQPTRPPADPAIEAALTTISASGLRFYVPDDEAAPTEHTAEQFASMLRSKWDWLGYDITELEPWLEEIATCTFTGKRPYLVEVAPGQRIELRRWLAGRGTDPPAAHPHIAEAGREP